MITTFFLITFCNANYILQVYLKMWECEMCKKWDGRPLSVARIVICCCWESGERLKYEPFSRISFSFCNFQLSFSYFPFPPGNTPNFLLPLSFLSSIDLSSRGQYWVEINWAIKSGAPREPNKSFNQLLKEDFSAASFMKANFLHRTKTTQNINYLKMSVRPSWSQFETAS